MITPLAAVITLLIALVLVSTTLGGDSVPNTVTVPNPTPETLTGEQSSSPPDSPKPKEHDGSEYHKEEAMRQNSDGWESQTSRGQENEEPQDKESEPERYPDGNVGGKKNEDQDAQNTEGRENQEDRNHRSMGQEDKEKLGVQEQDTHISGAGEHERDTHKSEGQQSKTQGDLNLGEQGRGQSENKKAAIEKDADRVGGRWERETSGDQEVVEKDTDQVVGGQESVEGETSRQSRDEEVEKDEDHVTDGQGIDAGKGSKQSGNQKVVEKDEEDQMIEGEDKHALNKNQQSRDFEIESQQSDRDITHKQGDQKTNDVSKVYQPTSEGDQTTSEEEVNKKSDGPQNPTIYLPENEEPEYEMYLEAMDLIYRISNKDTTEGYKLLEQAAAKGNTRAKEMMAYSYIFGSYIKRNFTQAFEIFMTLADEGHPIGQQGLGFMYSAGIGVNSNQAKAVVHYVFAALGGHQFAQMAMGYRTLMGVGVVQSCEAALAYYRKSASKVIEKASLISGGIAVSKVRLMDEDDEVPSIYGVSEDEIVHYQSIFTDSGNTGAQFMLGLYYMFGMAGAQRSFKMALNFLKQAAKSGLPAAYALMGKIYAEGSDEIPQDFDLAYKNFKAAADLKHGDGFSGLGMLYFNGMGVKKDKRKALELFQKAAEKGYPEGQYYLGNMYYNGDGVRPDKGKGVKYFQLAAHGGHLYALYKLGKINADGIDIKRNCNFAVELFKSVSERGKFTRMFTEAQRMYSYGDVESSFLIYLLLAEMGFEVAQSNVAYLLEQGALTFISEEEQYKRGLLFWNRAAALGYSQARVKLGDYYYYGLGTEVSYEAAATQYRLASDKLATPQAMFNLAYMYEYGQGLEKDYHLAKRYYDMAAETSSEAIVPVNLALLKLNFMHMVNNYKEWLDFLPALGGHWDIYLISVLIGLVIILILWRTQH